MVPASISPFNLHPDSARDENIRYKGRFLRFLSIVNEPWHYVITRFDVYRKRNEQNQ